MDETEIETLTVGLEAEDKGVTSVLNKASEALGKVTAKAEAASTAFEEWTPLLQSFGDSVSKATSSLTDESFWTKFAVDMGLISEATANGEGAFSKWKAAVTGGAAVIGTATAALTTFKTTLAELPANFAAMASSAKAAFVNTVGYITTSYQRLQSATAALVSFVDEQYTGLAVGASHAWAAVGNVSIKGVMDGIANGIAAAGAKIVATFAAIRTAAIAAWTAVTVKFAAITAVVVAVAAALGYAGYKIYEWLSNVKQVEGELAEQLEKHNNEMEVYKNETIDIMKDVNKSLSGDARAQAMATPFIEITKSVKELKEQLEAAKEKQKDMQRITLSNRWTDYFGISARAKEAAQEIKVLTERLANAEDRQKQLNEAMGNEAIAKRVQELRNAVELEAASIGLSGREAEIARLEYQMLNSQLLITALEIEGLTAEADAAKKVQTALRDSIVKLREELTTLERNKAVFKLSEDSKKFAEELKAAVDNIGKSADQLTLEKLEKEAKRLGQEFDGKHFLQLLSAKEAAKQQEEFKKRAKELAKEVRTPLQVYEDKMEELNRMLGDGLISQDVYAEAVKKAEKALKDAGKEAKNTREELQKLDAVALGSADAMSRIRDYNRMLLRRDEDESKAPAGSYAPRSARREPFVMMGPDAKDQEFDVLKDILKVMQQQNDILRQQANPLDPMFSAAGL